MGFSTPFFFSLLLVPYLSCPAELQPALRVETFAHSEPLSIANSIFNDYEGNYSGGTRQMATNWIESGLRWREFGLSYLLRYDYDIRFSKDTARLFGLAKNKKDLPVGENIDIYVEAHAFHAQGLRAEFRRDFFTEKIRIAMGLSLLKANYMLDGHLKATGKIIGEKDYDYSATVEYQYTEDIIFDRQVSPATGSGYSLDFGVTWQITSKTRTIIKIIDFPGQIAWKKLPFTRAAASSDQKEYDENGYVQIKPAMEGREGFYQKYKQYLQTRGSLDICHELNTVALRLQAAVQYDFFTYALGYTQRLADNSYTLKFWPGINAFTLGFSLGNFQLNLTVDSIKYQELKTLGLQISYPM